MTWRPIPGWVGLYEASDDGQIRSLDRPWITPLGNGSIKRGRILRPGINPKGYRIVVLARDGGRFAYAVHRLVAEAFLGPLPAGYHTCHIDGDNSNNAASNLRYDTPRENNLDVVRHGRNVNANKTHCLHGHAFTPENTQRNGKRGRKCLTCHRERMARSRAAQRRRAAA